MHDDVSQNRTVCIKCRVTPEEYDYILKKMHKSGCKNISVYLRKMAISGLVIRYESELFLDLQRKLQSIANSVNQIAIRVNQNGILYQEDLSEIQRKVRDAWHILKSIQSTLRCIKPSPMS